MFGGGDSLNSKSGMGSGPGRDFVGYNKMTNGNGGWTSNPGHNNMSTNKTSLSINSQDMKKVRII